MSFIGKILTLHVFFTGKPPIYFTTEIAATFSTLQDWTWCPFPDEFLPAAISNYRKMGRGTRRISGWRIIKPYIPLKWFTLKNLLVNWKLLKRKNILNRQRVAFLKVVQCPPGRRRSDGDTIDVSKLQIWIRFYFVAGSGKADPASILRQVSSDRHPLVQDNSLPEICLVR